MTLVKLLIEFYNSMNFFNTKPRFNACLNFLYVWHIFLSWKLATSFSTFLNFHFFKKKLVNHYGGRVIFQDIEHPIKYPT